MVSGGVAYWAASDCESVEIDILDLDNIEGGDPVELSAGFLAEFGHLDAVQDALRIERSRRASTRRPI